MRLLKGMPAKVNLIPFNPWPGAPFQSTTGNRIAAFARIVNDAGFSAPIRRPRGRDILAACGQLKTETVKLRQGELLKQQQAEAAALVSHILPSIAGRLLRRLGSRGMSRGAPSRLPSRH